VFGNTLARYGTKIVVVCASLREQADETTGSGDIFSDVLAIQKGWNER